MASSLLLDCSLWGKPAAVRTFKQTYEEVQVVSLGLPVNNQWKTDTYHLHHHYHHEWEFLEADAVAPANGLTATLLKTSSQRQPAELYPDSSLT